VLAHLDDLRQDGPLGPIDAKDVGQLFQIDRGRFSNAKHGIAQPGHAQAPELFVEKLHAELRSEQGNVLDDGLTDTPLLVLGELHDGGQEGGREFLDADDCAARGRVISRARSCRGWRGSLTVVDHLELADQVQPDLRKLVLQQLEEEGQEVFLGGLFAEQGSQPADLLGECGTDVLRSIRRQRSDTGEDSGEDDVAVNQLGET